MASNIKIVTEGLSGNLSSFQAEMAKMQTLLGEIKTSTSNAKKEWEGTASDVVMGGIEKFQQVFDEIDTQNQKYASFLNAVIESYTKADESQQNALDSNASMYDVGK